MKRKLVLTTVSFACLLTGLTLVSCGKEQGTAATANYKTMEVSRADRMLSRSFTAVVNGRQSVEIRPQVSGTITKVCISEGALVKKDQPLFIIDQVPYQAALHTAEASVKSAEAAVANVRTLLTNDSPDRADVVVKFELKTADGGIAASSEARAKIPAGETMTVISKNLGLENPHLWDIDDPYLYTMQVSIRDRKSGEVLDEVSEPVGFRWFRFDPDEGFFLNGRHRKLVGTARHQDFAHTGNALRDEFHVQDVMLLKEMGGNFLRVSHYPQDPVVMDMCDKLGIVTSVEIPVINTVTETEAFLENCVNMAVEMVRQDFNRPSVMIWGYMNEILLHQPYPDGDTTDLPRYYEFTRKVTQALEDKIREEDPSRYTMLACHNGPARYEKAHLTEIPMILGWNLYQGWYVDKLEDFNKWCEDQHRRYPHHPMIISEWGAGSDRRLHTTEGRAFDFSMEYQQTYVEHYLPFIEEKEWISGCTYWNFIDFNVAARQESMPRVNNKGLFYNDRTPKDVAYYFKSMWRKDIPVLRIASRDWKVRVGKEGETQQIKLYSNLPEVELFVNGESAGKQATDNCHAVFNVVLPVGTSVLTAQGVYGNKPVEDVMTIDFRPLPDLSEGDELAINVGSNCFFTSALSNLTWLPDRPYVPGSWGYVSGEARSTTSEIVNTVDVPLYQTRREGEFTYKIDAPDGNYEVELLMADVTRPAAQLANLLGKNKSEETAGETRFNIVICGRQVETNFSPADGGRYRTAFKRRYIVCNEEGCITIALEAVKGKPFISGIKVRKL